MTNPTYLLVLWGCYPLWLLAGGVDYLCHRRTCIERTAGLRENHLHLWQFASTALLVLLAALFTVTDAMPVLLRSLVNRSTVRHC